MDHLRLHQAEVARERAARRRGVASKILGGCLILVISDLVVSLIIPFVGWLQILALRNLISPPQPVPDQIVAFTTSVTSWGQSLYAGDSLSSTGIFDRQSGKRLGTIPGIVVGSDTQFLYTSTGSRGLMNSIRGDSFTDALSARDVSGALAWTFDSAPYSLAAIQASPSSQTPQLVSDTQSVYALLVNRLSQPVTSKLVALDKATGALRWSDANPPGDHFILARGALALLTQGEQSQVTALSLSDGRTLWRQSYTNAQFFSDGTLIYALTSQALYALSPTSGARIWSVNKQPATQAMTMAAPVVFDGGSVYLLSASGQIIALRASDGRQRWQIAMPPATAVPLPLAAQNGVLYLWQDTPTLLLTAIDEASGRTLWATRVQVNRPRLTGVTDTTIYLSAYMWCKSASQSCAHYFAITRQSGKLAWSHAEPQALASDGVALVSASAQGQSLYLTTLVRRQSLYRATLAPRVLATPHRFDFSGAVPAGDPCSDTVTLTSLSAATGAVEWNHTTTASCAAPAP